jgi:hypothetical protein
MADSTVVGRERLIRTPVKLRTAQARMEVAGG